MKTVQIKVPYSFYKVLSEVAEQYGVTVEKALRYNITKLLEKYNKVDKLITLRVKFDNETYEKLRVLKEQAGGSYTELFFLLFVRWLREEDN